MSNRNAAVSIVVAFLLASFPVQKFAGDEPLTEAKEFFTQWVALGEAFDPSLADLYSDSAVIKNKRTYPDGRVRELSLTGTQYKTLLVQAMPTAKATGDISKYSEVTYQSEGNGARILATRFSELKQYSSPFSLLVVPDSEGRWLIVEEISESKP